MAVFILYFIPFVMDIVVSQLLFVGRHSMASEGASEAVVASIPFIYGAGYFLSGPLMRAIIRPRLSKVQMLTAVALITALSLVLAQVKAVLTIQVLFFFLPIGVSFFFNAFQAFMLGVSNVAARPLSVTVSLYTFAWSLGFGFGPLISGIATGYFSWSDNYYMAAGISILIAMIIVGFRPDRGPANSNDLETDKTERVKSPPLFIPGWMGVVIGLFGWLTIATYWPVIAEREGISTTMRGLVEFAFAMAQGFGALALIFLRDWQRKIVAIPFFGLFGISALLVFGVAGGPVFYILGASLMGLFTAGTFLFSVYHCMLDSKQASRRVAVNEMMVGLGFLVGPGIAALLHQADKPFTHAFSMAPGLVGALVSVETWIAVRLSRRYRIDN